MPANQKIPIHPALQPYVVEILVIRAAKSRELAMALPYKVLPQPYPVMGFQFQGRLAVWRDNETALLERSGLTSLQTASRLFQPQLDTGTVLVIFRPYGIFPLLGYAMHELSDLHPGLDLFLAPATLRELEERLAETPDPVQLAEIVQTFLLKLIERAKWSLPPSVIAATDSIIQAPGQVRVETLATDWGYSGIPFTCPKTYGEAYNKSGHYAIRIVTKRSICDELEETDAFPVGAVEPYAALYWRGNGGALRVWHDQLGSDVAQPDYGRW